MIMIDWRARMLTREYYCDAFTRDAAAIAALARRRLAAPVPSCPGWSVASLITHLAADVYATRVRQFQALPNEARLESFTDLGLPARFEAWVDGDRANPDLAPDGLIELFEETAATLGSLLRAADPGQPIKTWWAPQQNAAFLQRRMALETAIHRWDAQLAHNMIEPIDSDLAADGVDETLDIMVPARRGWAEQPRTGQGESYHLHRTDGAGEWIIRFPAGGPVVTREHARCDVAIRGNASDLFLFLWQRIPASRLEVHGDSALVDRYFELVPPD
jgi:uncharacterized protein (TIGR03083 family)